MNTKVLGKDYTPSKFKVTGKENYRRGCPTAVWWLPQPLPSLLHWPGQDKMKIASLEAFHQYHIRGALPGSSNVWRKVTKLPEEGAPPQGLVDDRQPRPEERCQMW